MEDEGKQEEKFDFNSDGESLGYISLDQAQVLALRTARESPEDYGVDFLGIRMSFDISGSRETDDHYVITLLYRPLGSFSGHPGREQFYISKEGVVENRQVSLFPSKSTKMPIAAIAMVAIVGIAILGAVLVMVSGDNGEQIVPTIAPRDFESSSAAIADNTRTPLPTQTRRPTPTATTIPTPTPTPNAEWALYQSAIQTMMADYAFSSITAGASPAFITKSLDFDAGSGSLVLFGYIENEISNFCYTWDATGRILTQVTPILGSCP